MEKYVAFHVVRFLESNSKLADHQFGFRAGHSTVHPLMLAHHLVSDCLDKNCEARLIALDIAGAFDCVWHRKLL
jgi:hypothetical protein